MRRDDNLIRLSSRPPQHHSEGEVRAIVAGVVAPDGVVVDLTVVHNSVLAHELNPNTWSVNAAYLDR